MRHADTVGLQIIGAKSVDEFDVVSKEKKKAGGNNFEDIVDVQPGDRGTVDATLDFTDSQQFMFRYEVVY